MNGCSCKDVVEVRGRRACEGRGRGDSAKGCGRRCGVCTGLPSVGVGWVVQGCRLFGGCARMWMGC